VFGVANGGSLRLLLSVAAPDGQYVMSVDPSTHQAHWTHRISSEAESYTGAWTVQSSATGNCAIVVGSESGITELCPYNR
jgi:hypothetical protein